MMTEPEFRANLTWALSLLDMIDEFPAQAFLEYANKHYPNSDEEDRAREMWTVQDRGLSGGLND